jgi:predicted dehydrogenase
MSNTHPTNRRNFLKIAAASVTVPYLIPRSVLAQNGNPGANEKVVIGVVGAGYRIREIMNHPKLMRLQAICDVQDSQINLTIDGNPSPYRTYGGYKTLDPDAVKAVRYKHYREMFDKEKLDGVFITTPTHVRARITLLALAAGFDVYGEKPFALTAEQGRAIVNAVKKYKRVYQCGAQARSIPFNQWAVKQLYDGAIGKIMKAEMTNFLSPIDYKPNDIAADWVQRGLSGRGKTVGSDALDKCPADLDWDAWCGPAPLYPFHELLLGSTEGWGLFRDYDNGGSTWGMTGFGTHAFDQIQWALNKDNELPVEIEAAEPNHPKNRSPFTMTYADGTQIVIREEGESNNAFGGFLYGDKGKAEITRGQFRTNPKAIADAAPQDIRRDELDHVKNWLECIKTRETPRTSAAIAHNHTLLCNFGVICREVPGKLKFDAKTETFDNAAANNHPSMKREARKGHELPKV